MTKICVTAQGGSLDARVDPRFGRCRYFIFTDMDISGLEVVENPNIDFMGGAGIPSAQLVALKKAGAVLTGNVGPNAYQTLQAAGIEVYTGASGSVKEAIEAYRTGALKKAESASVGSKFGIAKGR